MNKFTLKVFAAVFVSVTAATSAFGENYPIWHDPGARLDIKSVYPKGGSDVDVNTDVVAILDYSIEDFAEGKYLIAAQFDTTTNGNTTDGAFPNGLYPVPTSKHGEAIFKFPLRYVWNEKGLAHPLTMHFLLLRKTTGTSSVMAAETEALHFSTK